MEHTLRLHRFLVRWGLIGHPWGRKYVKAHVGPLGGYVHAHEPRVVAEENPADGSDLGE